MGKCIITLPPPITYSYVDLGLPSGTKWATQNVGARKPSDYGLYFQWGDTSGYTIDQVGTGDGQKKFASDRSDYKWRKSSNFTKYTTKGESSTAPLTIRLSNFTKYKNPGDTLELEDDAAHVNMGGDWHMPTPTQIQELINTANTTSTWTAQDGVYGTLFTSKKDGTKSIFIPAAGNAWDGLVRSSGGYGVVWSSMLDTDSANYGQNLDFDSGSADLGNYGRYGGLSVRGVVG